MNDSKDAPWGYEGEMRLPHDTPLSSAKMERSDKKTHKRHRTIGLELLESAGTREPSLLHTFASDIGLALLSSTETKTLTRSLVPDELTWASVSTS